MDPTQDEARREVARIMLEALKDTDFVLTGAGALAEHDLIHRPTKDVDLFTVGDEGQQIPDVIPRLRDALTEHGATLTIGREFPGFVDGQVTWGDQQIGFDLGVDWRAHPAVTMDIGPVLDIRDSVGSKTAALYSRNEVRDYADVAAIVLDGRWSPEEIMAMGATNDPGFDRAEFAHILDPTFWRFPESEDFRDMGIAAATETRARDALTVLRYAALGQDVDLETVEAARVSRGGRLEPLRDQIARNTERPSAQRPTPAHDREEETGHER